MMYLKKYAQLLNAGMPFVNTLMLSLILISLGSLGPMGMFWRWITLIVVAQTALGLSIGTIIRRLETVYLKGKYLSKIAPNYHELKKEKIAKEETDE